MVREGDLQQDEDYSMTWMTLTKLILVIIGIQCIYDKLSDVCKIEFPDI